MITFRRFSSKYAFYDLVVKTPARPHPIEAALMKQQDYKKLKSQTKTTFEGNYSLGDMTPQQRIEQIFGGRIRGETRQSSSRLNRGEPRVISGVTVPDKPVEPDNCCMSGCINCVWELYNDDIKDWNSKRKLAAEKVNKEGKDFVWPSDFHPPINYLAAKHVPEELKAKQEEVARDHRGEEKEVWGNVPVAMRVFAEVEKKIKAKHKKAAQQQAAPSA